MQVTDRTETCPLCASHDLRIILGQDSFRIHECTVCRLGITLPKVFVSEPDYNGCSERAQGYIHREDLFRAYARDFLSRIRRYAPAGRLLDIGCSIGILVDEARKLGYQAEGLDLDSTAIAYGRTQRRAVHGSSIEEWPYGDYDVICMSHTLEHVADPAPFLSACKSRLREDGRIAVSLPCHTGLPARVFRQRWAAWMPSQHYFHYSPLSLECLFHCAGLRPLNIWQESLGYRLGPLARYHWKEIAKSLAFYCVGGLGAAIGQGDQLFGVARRSEDGC